MKKWYLIFAGLVGCTSQPLPPYDSTSDNKVLIAIVADYSKSYRNIVILDSTSINSLILRTAKTGGTLVHIAVQDNSSAAPVYVTRIEKLDTVNASTEKNTYKAARLREKTKQRIAAYAPVIQQSADGLLGVIRGYSTATSFTDLQHGLDLAHVTVCESIYTSETAKYKRYVLILSDMLNDPPYSRNKKLIPVDFCGATALIVRPSPAVSTDSLRAICGGAEVHVFTTINDAILFVNQ